MNSFRKFKTMTYTTPGLQILCATLLILVCVANIHAQDRIALLIANTDYGQNQLPESERNVKQLAAALDSAGFVVTVKKNAGKELKQDLEAFVDSYPDGGISLLYYSGFGGRLPRKLSRTEVDRDGKQQKVYFNENHSSISPVEGSPVYLSDLARSYRERSTARLSLLVFECAVAHPQISDPEYQGLGEVDPREFGSVMICQAMSPGKTLPESISSRLAESLSRHIVATDEPIGDVMASVADDVRKQSGGKQEIWHRFSHSIDTHAIAVSSRKRKIHTSKLPPSNPQPGDEWINGIGMVFVWCPPGSFQMGLRENESPQTRDAAKVNVTISRGFWIGKYEMAAGTYVRLRKGMGQGRLVLTGNVPATVIEGNAAAKNLTSISEAKAGRIPAGWEYRLPTEAEWEYACRAGTETRYSFGDSVSDLHRHANYADAALIEDDDYFYYCDTKSNDGVGKRPAPLGCYAPNAWGIHDMHGNVSEACLDGYADSLPGGVDPVGVGGNGMTVLRGGAWCSQPEYCLAGFRNPVTFKHAAVPHAGVRLVLAKRGMVEKKKQLAARKK
jgi:formylglycine-generating enzyme required for sulfatase activity